MIWVAEPETEENQEHLLECPDLQDNEVAQSVLLYSDIFGDNSEISKILRKKIKILKNTQCEHRGAPWLFCD